MSEVELDREDRADDRADLEVNLLASGERSDEGAIWTEGERGEGGERGKGEGREF